MAVLLALAVAGLMIGALLALISLVLIASDRRSPYRGRAALGSLAIALLLVMGLGVVYGRH